MAELNSALFKKQAAEKLYSPEDLDRYVHIAKPGIWVLLAMCTSFIVGLIVWGFFGTVYVNVNATGARIGNKVCCYLPSENASHVRVGNSARVNDEQLRVASISDIPLSKDELEKAVGSDYLVYQLSGNAEWVYEITFEGEGAGNLQEGVPLSVGITADQVTPVEMAFDTKE
ncbi:MAG: hypothetical protein IKG21_12430 [Atopobiaceae bacterium]|nr:hypothetical protein [Atopobiaceae bacterium]